MTDEFARRVAVRQQEVVDGITPQLPTQRMTGGETMVHQLTFGPVGMPESSEVAHVITGKEADVIDMECPTCGAKIFIYYCRALWKGGADEQQKEGGKE